MKGKVWTTFYFQIKLCSQKVLNGYYIHTEHVEISYLFSKKKEQHNMMCDMCKTSVQDGFLF